SYPSDELGPLIPMFKPSKYFIRLLPFLSYIPDMTVPNSHFSSDPLCVVPSLLTFLTTEFLPHTIKLELCSATLTNHFHSHASILLVSGKIFSKEKKL